MKKGRTCSMLMQVRLIFLCIKPKIMFIIFDNKEV